MHVAGIAERGTWFTSFCGVAGGPCLCLGRWRQVNCLLHHLITSSHCGRENEGRFPPVALGSRALCTTWAVDTSGTSPQSLVGRL